MLLMGWLKFPDYSGSWQRGEMITNANFLFIIEGRMENLWPILLIMREKTAWHSQEEE